MGDSSRWSNFESCKGRWMETEQRYKQQGYTTSRYHGALASTQQRLFARAHDRIVNISLVLQAKLRALAPGLAPWHLFCAPSQPPVWPKRCKSLRERPPACLQPASSLPPACLQPASSSLPPACLQFAQKGVNPYGYGLRHASVITNYTCRPAVKTRRRVVKKRAQMTRLDF